MTTASQTPVPPDFAEPLTLPETPPAPAPVAPEPMSAPGPAEEAAEPEPAKPEWEPESDWEHDFIDFHGDRIAYRVPTQGAYAALQLTAGPGATTQEASFYGRYFLSSHLSPASFQRFFTRCIKPDGYPEDADPQTELSELIAQPLLDRLKAEFEEAKAKNEAAKKAGSARK